MNNLIFTRIDDRLIHGQVCAAWLKQYPEINYILIVDDDTAKDPFMHEMFKLLVPSGISIEIKNVETAIPFLKKGLNKKTMMIVKTPQTIKRLFDGGIFIDELNIGGMGMNKTRKKLYQNIASTNEENDILKYLLDKGMHIYIQIIPASKSIDLQKVLKE